MAGHLWYCRVVRKRLAVVIVGLMGCRQAGPGAVEEVPPELPRQSESEPAVQPESVLAPEAEPEAEPEISAITVLMTSATLADDCGGGPMTPPPVQSKQEPERIRSKGDAAKRGRRAKRRCKQTSIQLAIVAADGAEPASVTVKSVELLLESGESVDTLMPREPSVWTDGDGYEPWDEKIGPGQDLSVSYALSRPDWGVVQDRRNKTYTVKAVVSIAGADQMVEHKATVSAPTSLPPNVKT